MANVSLHSTTGFSDDNTLEKSQSVDPFETRRKLHQKRNRLYHAFLKKMPRLTKECINASEYYFENGLRKVR